MLERGEDARDGQGNSEEIMWKFKNFTNVWKIARKTRTYIIIIVFIIIIIIIFYQILCSLPFISLWLIVIDKNKSRGVKI